MTTLAARGSELSRASSGFEQLFETLCIYEIPYQVDDTRNWVPFYCRTRRTPAVHAAF